jgi:hypothetical protein
MEPNVAEGLVRHTSEQLLQVQSGFGGLGSVVMRKRDGAWNVAGGFSRSAGHWTSPSGS